MEWLWFCQQLLTNGGCLGRYKLQVVSEDGKKVRRVHPLPEVDLEEVQVNAQSIKKA
jgi:hypothetical protein